MPILSIAEFSRRSGRKRSSIYNDIKNGKIKLIKRVIHTYGINALELKKYKG